MSVSVSLINDSSEIIEVFEVVVIKLGMATASDMLMHHGTCISLYRLCIYDYIVFFNLLLFLSILFYNCFHVVLKRQTEMVNGTSIS